MRNPVLKPLSLVILLLALLGGCSAAGAPSPSAGTVSIRGVATAGPVCPVERPGDSACAPRPVGGATIVVKAAGGAEVRRVTTASDGSFAVDLVAGDYVLVPQPVEGLMGTAEQIAISVPAAGAPLPSPVQIQYDTGIR
jgi:hypothetical protein